MEQPSHKDSWKQNTIQLWISGLMQVARSTDYAAMELQEQLTQVLGYPTTVAIKLGSQHNLVVLFHSSMGKLTTSVTFIYISHYYKTPTFLLAQ